MGNWRRWKLFWMDHWVKIAIIFASIVLVLLSVWGMASLESYYRNITLAQLPLQMIIMVINAVVFAYIYMMLFRGGLSKMDKKGIKARDVNVRFSDVIGFLASATSVRGSWGRRFAVHVPLNDDR